MNSFLLQVRTTIRKHDALGEKDRILIGCSGGADSVCLVLVLKELGCDVSIAHVNHGLRGAASDEDENFTAELARRLGVSFYSRKVRLDSGNVEAAGRAARKRVFRELMHEHGLTKLALAHTENDRIETFLLNLLRGSGVEGLVSMPAVSGDTVRPLIETRRAQVEAYLKDENQTWRTDLSNFDLALARNRLRQSVIPQLVADFNPKLLETLTRTIEILEGENDWMRAASDHLLAEHGTSGAAAFVLSSGLLEHMPTGLVRRLLRGGLERAGSDLQDVTFEHIEAARGLLGHSKSGKFVEIPGRFQVARDFDKLVFRRTSPQTTDYDYELKIPGTVHIPELRKIFRAEIVEDTGNAAGAGRVFVDGDSLGPYVRIRNWKPGDYYKPVGWPAGKLKKLFQRARVPRRDRSNWPVVVSDSAIVWVALFPISREFAPRGYSQKVVAIEALPA